METEKNLFRTIFGNTPIIGMIHLAGENPLHRALEEIAIFEEEGIDAALVENYHNSIGGVVKTVEVLSKRDNKIVIGVNILPNEYNIALKVAAEYGAKFIQMDYVAGTYTRGSLDVKSYSEFKEKFPGIAVLGGVWPKYYHPVKGSVLEEDLKQGMERADALVVTGQGTGMQTPLDKIKKFRTGCGNDYPIIVGAGLTPDNAYEQLMIADGAIVGSCLKHNNETYLYVERDRVKRLMDVVKKVREEKVKKNGA